MGNVDFQAPSTELKIPMLSARGPRLGVGLDPDDERLDFDLQRLAGPLEGTDLDGALPSRSMQSFNGSLSGAWWHPSRSGEGQFLSVETFGERTVASVYCFTYGADGLPT